MPTSTLETPQAPPIMPRPIEPLQNEFFNAVAAKPSVLMQIDENNVGHLISKASGDHTQPYAVMLAESGRYLTIGLDFDSGHAGADRAHEDATIAVDLLRRGGIRAVLAASGPTGGRHVLATIQSPGIAATQAARLVERLAYLGLNSLDPTPMLNPRTGALRPPLAPHRFGGRSQIFGDPTYALSELRSPAAAPLVDTFVRALPFRSLATQRLDGGARSATIDLTAQGPTPTKYKSGSEVIQALLTGCQNRDETLDEAMKIIQEAHPESPVSRAWTNRDPRTRNAWAARSWDKAGEFVSEHAARPARESDSDSDVLNSWTPEAIESLGLSPLAQRCALALADLAKAVNRTLIGCSVRELAERAGSGRDTARKALDVLTKGGALEIAGQDRGQEGRRFRLRHARHWATCAERTVSPSTSKGGVRQLTVRSAHPGATLVHDLNNDIWSTVGLGERARQVYEHLVSAQTLDAALSVDELADALGVTAGTVRRHLGRLSDAGLALSLGRGRWAADVCDLEALSERLGAAGNGARRKERHRQERMRERIRTVVRKLEVAGVAPVEPWFHAEFRHDETVTVSTIYLLPDRSTRTPKKEAA